MRDKLTKMGGVWTPKTQYLRLNEPGLASGTETEVTPEGKDNPLIIQRTDVRNGSDISSRQVQISALNTRADASNGGDTRNRRGPKHPKDLARFERGRLLKKLPRRRDGPKWHNQLNGNNGSWTNTDDHALRAPDDPGDLMREVKDASGREHKGAPYQDGNPYEGGPEDDAPSVFAGNKIPTVVVNCAVGKKAVAVKPPVSEREAPKKNTGHANSPNSRDKRGRKGRDSPKSPVGPQRSSGKGAPPNKRARREFEGGKEAPRLCNGCSQPGHLYRDCPVREGLVVERPISSKELEGKRAADALHLLEPEAADPSEGDDSRVLAIVKPDVKPVVVELTRAQKGVAVELNLRDKAITMLVTKNLGSAADRRVVLQNLTQLARKEKFYEFDDHADDKLMNIYSSAVKKAYDLRLKTAKDLSSSRRKHGKRALGRTGALSRGLQGLPSKYSNWDKETLKDKSDLDILGFYEGIPVFSLDRINNPYPCFYYGGLLLRLIFSLFAEKLLYAFFLMVLASPKSPGARLLFPCFTKPRTLLGVDCLSADTLPCQQGWAMENECEQGARTLAVVLSFFILVVVEVYFLSCRCGSIVEKVFDGLLRCSFHALDAFLTLSVLVISPLQTLIAPEVLMMMPIPTAYMNWAVDLGMIVWLFVHMIHVIWNVYCVFWLKQPWRCFSIIEAVMHLDDICLEDHEMKRYPTQQGFRCVIGDTLCKLKSSLHVFWGLTGIIPTVFSSCSHNEKISMEGRVGKQLPAHRSPQVLASIKKNWSVLILAVDNLFNLIPKSEPPMDFYDWAHSFPPGRRRELLRTREDCHDMPPLSAKSFIKREIALKNEDQLEFKDPRFIQGCPLELSAAVGPTLRVWTKQVVRFIGPEAFTSAEILSGRHVLYTCGRSNEEIGTCFRNAIRVIDEMTPGEDIVFLEDDQSRFDLHLTEGPFNFLKKMYSRKLPKRVSGLLRRGVCRGTSSLGTKYSIPYTMQSGWPDTSVGDSLVNAAMKMYIHGKGRPWISIICGDDSVTVTTRGEIDRVGGLTGIIDKYASLGMEIEAKLSVDPLDVEFCSGRFYPVDDSYVLFPKTARILGKIACDLKLRRPDDQVAWLRGITATLECFGSIDPILGALGRSFRVALGQGREIYDDGWDSKSHFDGSIRSERHDVNMYYDHHYGLNEKQIDDLIAELSQQKPGQLLDSALLKGMALVDMA